MVAESESHPRGKIRNFIEKARERINNALLELHIGPKAKSLLPIAEMLQYDILDHFSKLPTSLNAVFIGPRSAAFIEANALRIACRERNIQPQTIFIIEKDDISIYFSTDTDQRRALDTYLSKNSITNELLTDGTIRIDDDDFRIYSSSNFISEVQAARIKGESLSLPPIVIINGDAGDPSLVESIINECSKDSSLLTIARNIGAFPYEQIAEMWSKQITKKNANQNPSFLAFTTHVPAYRDMLTAQLDSILKPNQINILINGELLSHPPNLIKSGGGWTDQYIHLIGDARTFK